MTVRVYKSTDTSAPTLSGTAGDLVNLLDKCLVSGYGSQAAAGWTKPYVGTNKAAFQQGAGSSGFLLRVQDDGPGAGTTKEARVVGYEAMTGVDTGTNLFPTAAQMTNGLFCRKSAAADATTRVWMLVADETMFYLFVATGDTANQCMCLAFGDMVSFKSVDPYKCIIMARFTENSAAGSADGLSIITGTFGTAGSGNYISRSYTGIGGSTQVGKHTDSNKVGSIANIGCGGSIPYPHPVDNGLLMSPVWVHESTTVLRGYLKGLWAPLHNKPLTGTPVAGDTFDGVGGLVGKSFQALDVVGTTAGQVLLETSNTWS